MCVKRSGELSGFQYLHLARLGALAPSRNNTQPWKFSFEGNAIQVHPDLARRLPALDPADRSIYLSLGCVVENIVLAAEYYGLSAEVDYFGRKADESALISFAACGRPGSVEFMPVMSLRQCVRRPFDDVNIAPIHLRKLVRSARQAGVEFGLVTDKHQIDRIADVLRSGDSTKAHIDAISSEMASWTRFSNREAESRRDGLLFLGMGYPPMPGCIGRRLVATLVRKNRQAEESASLVRASAALIVFAPHRDDRIHWFNVGRSFQRVVLSAASLRMRYAHLRLPYALPSQNADLTGCLGLEGAQEFVALRIGYSDLVLPSVRRRLSSLLRGFSGFPVEQESRCASKA